jgi:hypothetical protein
MGHALLCSYFSFGNVQNAFTKNANLLNFELYLDNMGIDHHARTFSILDVVGMIGGVCEILLVVFGILVFPIAEHSWYLSAAKRLYLARTSNEYYLHKNRNGEEGIMENNEYKMTVAEDEEIGLHKTIIIRYRRNCCVFIRKLCRPLAWFC